MTNRLRLNADGVVAAAREIPAPQPTIAQRAEIRDNGGRGVPTTRAACVAAARELRAQGMRVDDLAAALRIGRAAAVSLLLEIDRPEVPSNGLLKSERVSNG